MAASDEIDVERVALEKLKFQARSEIASSQWVGNISASTAIDFETNNLVMKLRAEVWAERLGMQTWSWPRNWVEAVKERWAPRWLKRRWPVKYDTGSVTLWHKYPNLTVGGDKGIRHITVSQYPH